MRSTQVKLRHYSAEKSACYRGKRTITWDFQTHQPGMAVIFLPFCTQNLKAGFLYDLN